MILISWVDWWVYLYVLSDWNLESLLLPVMTDSFAFFYSKEPELAFVWDAFCAT